MLCPGPGGGVLPPVVGNCFVNTRLEALTPRQIEERMETGNRGANMMWAQGTPAKSRRGHPSRRRWRRRGLVVLIS